MEELHKPSWDVVFGVLVCLSSSLQAMFGLPGCVALVVKLTVMPTPKLCLFLALISQQALGPRNATPLINKVNKRYMYTTQDPDL